MSPDAAGAPPRVILAIPDQWPRALLRAELRERGYDAVGAKDLVDALGIPASDPGRGPVRLLLVDHGALAGPEDLLLFRLSGRYGDPPVVLLASAATAPPRGPWTRVLRRPVSIGEIADAVAALVPLA
jgi:hypothetical protein